jgi:DNA-binding CsgD family transcriptional regulator
MSPTPESHPGAGAWPGDPARGPLVGRDAELSLLRGMVDPIPVASRVLVVLGDAGTGKSVLLADMAQRARSAGVRVLAVTGRESETDLPFAALHQLLRPVADSAGDLPARQSKALRGAFGLTAGTVPPDRLLTGIAALTLLSGVSEVSPLLVIVDDAHLLDRSSLDVLSFVGRRLGAERVVLVLGGRGPAPLAGLDSGFPELRLEPLLASDANRLLDSQPHPPRGRARGQVLAQAVGNPMALIELAKVIAADPSVGRRWGAEPLPLSRQLSAVLTARFAGLPEPTRAALLLAAIAGSPGPGAGTGPGPGAGTGPGPGAGTSAAAGGTYGLAADVLAPAERLGLVKVNRTGLQFSHPLVRSAIYHTAPFAERAAAHRRLAEALADQPDRQAWHLAAASLSPDERVASLLEATAGQVQRRGGAATAALALERAAELSPDREDQARRLISAASVAVSTGQADWVEDLAGRALAITADPERQIAARRAVGWALAWTSQHVAALSVLIAVAEEASAARPALAWGALGTAAAVAYQSGTPASRQAVARTLDHLERQAPPPPAGAPSADLDALQVWIRAGTNPFAGRHELVSRLHRLTAAALDDPSVPGAAAWLLDEPELAVELLQEAVHRLASAGVRGASGAALSALGWSYIDTGRWDDALAVCAEASDLAEAYQMDIVAAAADVSVATVLAGRADPSAARAHVGRALARVDPAQSRGVTARAWHALGIAALADGDHLMAYGQLRQLFYPDGSPLHYHVSYLGVADLAAAAVRAGRQLEGREILDRALRHLDGAPSPRLEQLLARARGILADPASAEPHFDKALSDQAAERWPFERAQLQLDYAEWLRRQRRINDAKPMLAAALETFRRLRARSWAQRAETELRASGVSIPDSPDALAELTPQQRQIIHLASDGLTNREIADRLYLSPRTVSSHLYRSYPKLGVAGRHQLRDMITRAGARPTADPRPAADPRPPGD